MLFKTHTLVFGLLLSSALSYAAPPAAAPDDMGSFLSEKGLLTQLGNQIGQVGHNVSERASELVVNAMGFLGVPYRRGGNTV